MPTLTKDDVALLVEIKKWGLAAIFTTTVKGGRLRIGTAVYTCHANPGVITSFERLQERKYIESELGTMFHLTEAGQRRLLTAGW